MARAYPDLVALDGFPFPVWVSPGTEERALRMVERCQRAEVFLAGILQRDVQLCVLVLAPEQWERHTPFPTYGMPHVLDDGMTLILAGHESAALVPPLAGISRAAHEAARRVYGQSDGSLDFAPFFDLLGIHETAHLFHLQAGFAFPRRWLAEFFCNLCLHAYMSVAPPDQLPQLTTFPRMISEGGMPLMAHVTLADFEQWYNAMPAPNYGWYQCQLHVAAQEVFDLGGITVLQRLWDAFVQPLSSSTDDSIAAYLGRAVHPQLEHLMRQWPLYQENASASVNS